MGRPRGLGRTDLRAAHRTRTAPSSGETESLDSRYVAVESARRHARAAEALADERFRAPARRPSVTASATSQYAADCGGGGPPAKSLPLGGSALRTSVA